MKRLMKCWLLLLAVAMLPGCQEKVIQLFNGSTLEGWTCNPAEADAHWRAENGRLVGENPDQQASILWTTGQYRDFEVELDYMTTSDDYDSGVFLRGESHQVQIGISRSLQKDMTGCIYAPVDDRGSYPGQTDKIAEFHRKGEWNHLRVIVKGQRIRTFLNGEPFVDYEALQMPEEGPVGVQLHGGVHMVINFKNIRLRELPPVDAL